MNFVEAVENLGLKVSEVGVDPSTINPNDYLEEISNCRKQYNHSSLVDYIQRSKKFSPLLKGISAEPNFVLYENKERNIVIVLALWSSSATTIHNHDFSGFYFNLLGESLVVNFKEGEENVVVSDFQSLSSSKGAGLLKATPHLVGHLSEQTVTLIVRERLPNSKIETFSLDKYSNRVTTAITHSFADLIFYLSRGEEELFVREFEKLDLELKTCFMFLHSKYAQKLKGLNGLDIYQAQKAFQSLNWVFTQLVSDEVRKMAIVLYVSKSREDLMKNFNLMGWEVDFTFEALFLIARVVIEPKYGVEDQRIKTVISTFLSDCNFEDEFTVKVLLRNRLFRDIWS